MADYMQLLKVLIITMNLSNSAIIFYNTPSKDLNSYLIRNIRSEITGTCFTNVDPDERINQDRPNR